MSTWKAILSSGGANGEVSVSASSKSDAKNIIFDQFLGLLTSSIIWDKQPTFWVVMHDIFELKDECRDTSLNKQEQTDV